MGDSDAGGTEGGVWGPAKELQRLGRDRVIYDQLDPAAGKKAKRVVVRRPKFVCISDVAAHHWHHHMARSGCIRLRAPSRRLDT